MFWVPRDRQYATLSITPNHVVQDAPLRGECASTLALPELRTRHLQPSPPAFATALSEMASSPSVPVMAPLLALLQAVTQISLRTQLEGWDPMHAFLEARLQPTLVTALADVLTWLKVCTQSPTTPGLAQVSTCSKY